MATTPKGRQQRGKPIPPGGTTAQHGTVEAAIRGEDVRDAQANAKVAEARIADLEVRLRELDVAVDEAGNRLAVAIAANRDAWLKVLRKADADASERLRSALAEARAALAELRPARGAVGWLASFNAEQAQNGGSFSSRVGSCG